MLQNLKKHAVNYIVSAAMVLGMVAAFPTGVKATAIIAADVTATAVVGTKEVKLVIAGTNGDTFKVTDADVDDFVVAVTTPALTLTPVSVKLSDDKKTATITLSETVRAWDDLAVTVAASNDTIFTVANEMAAETVAVSGKTQAVVASATGTATGNKITVKLSAGEFDPDASKLASNWTLDNGATDTIDNVTWVSKTEVVITPTAAVAASNVTILPKQAALRAMDTQPSAAKPVALKTAVVATDATATAQVSVNRIEYTIDTSTTSAPLTPPATVLSPTAARIPSNWELMPADNTITAVHLDTSVADMEIATITLAKPVAAGAAYTIMPKDAAFATDTASGDGYVATSATVVTLMSGMTISDVAFKGTIGTALTSKDIVLELKGGTDTFDTMAAGTDAEIYFGFGYVDGKVADYTKGLPKGLSAKIKSATASKVTVTISGTPKEMIYSTPLLVEYLKTGATTSVNEKTYYDFTTASTSTGSTSGNNNNNNDYSSGRPARGTGAGLDGSANVGTVTPTDETKDPYAQAGGALTTSVEKIELNIGQSTASVDGASKAFPENYGAPYVDKAGNTMMPVRLFAESVGATVTYPKPEIHIMDAKGNKVVVKLNDSNIYDGNGKVIGTLKDASGKSVTPYLDTTINRAYLPFRAVLEGVFGFSSDEIKYENGKIMVDTKMVAPAAK